MPRAPRPGWRPGRGGCGRPNPGAVQRGSSATMKPLPVLSSGSSASSIGRSRCRQSSVNAARSQTDQCRSSSERRPLRVALDQLGERRQFALPVERAIPVRNDQDDHAAGDPPPFEQRRDRVGEVLDHVRGEHEVDAVVREREPVARCHHIDRRGTAALVSLVPLVHGVRRAEAVDVERVDAEVVVCGGTDLDPAQAVEPTVDERRGPLRPVVVQHPARVTERETERMTEDGRHGAQLAVRAACG